MPDIIQTDLLIPCLREKTLLSDFEGLSEKISDVAVFNTEASLFFYEDEIYKEFFDNCDAVAIDGAFLKLACSIRGLNMDRYHGPDLMGDVLKFGRGKKIIVGGSSSNCELIAKGVVDFHYDLPYSSDVNYLVDHFVKNFNFERSERTYLFISLGLPKQEHFAFRLRKKLNEEFSDVSSFVTIIPVGAAADFINGSKKRSSKIWQRLGLEWLPRLIREPRMLIRNIRSLKAFFIITIRG